VLYVLKGHARILGPSGVNPEKLDPGDVVYIPPGMPHVIENMGRQAPAVMLDLFAPMGPERVYRDPKDPAGRAAFEVIREPNPTAPPGAQFTVASIAKAETLSVFGGKGKARPLLEPAKTGNRGLYVGMLEADPGAEVPRNSHPGAAEILFVISGEGEVTVGSEKIPFGAEEALHIPEGQPHAAKFKGSEKAVVLQIFAPAGPEQRYRGASKKTP
jgi:quercetin dioxygenase-like cupin family protein